MRIRMINTTVILCAFNQQDYVQKALESIINQTNKDFKLIIIDNGSTDQTFERINEFMYQNSSNIKFSIFRNSNNEKITKVFNFAVSQVNTKYLCFIAGDDYYKSNYIADHKDAIENLGEEYGLVYSDYLIENSYGDITPGNSFSESGYVFESLVISQMTNFIAPFTPFYRSSVFNSFQYNEDNFSEGEAFLIRVSSRFLFKFIHSESYVMFDHQGNQGKNYKENLSFFLKNTYFQIREFPQHERILKRVASRMLVRYAWIISRLLGETKLPIQILLKAIRFNAFILFFPRFYLAIFIAIFAKFINKAFRPKSYKGKSAIAIDKKYAK